MYKQKKQSDYLVISYSIKELSAPEGNHQHHILAVTGKRAKKKWTSLSTSSHHTRFSTCQSTDVELTHLFNLATCSQTSHNLFS